MRAKYFTWLLCSSLFVLSSCGNLKYLPEGEKLYTGAKVRLIATERLSDKSMIQDEAESVIRPRPNKKFLGLRLKLWIYNIAGNPKGIGFRYWLKNKVGEPPVLLSDVRPSTMTEVIDARLFNKGVFQSRTEFNVIEKEKKAKIIYNCNVHSPYKLDSLQWPSGEDDLSRAIRETAPDTKLKQQENYDLDLLRQERDRISYLLKDRGYFYFTPDYVLFSADTMRGNKTVSITVSTKDDIPNDGRVIYKLNDIYVVPDYSFKSDSTLRARDTLLVDDVYYVEAEKTYRPQPILRSVFLHKGEQYRISNHQMTLSRLMSMGVFKFVNVRFSEADSTNPGHLNTFINLTPLPKKSIRAEFEVVSKSNNFLGPNLTLSYQNRNALGGAEQLSINLHGSLETQINGQYEGLFSYNVGPEISLSVPRFIVPFRIKNPKGFNIPKTRFTVGYDFLKRVQYFNLNSLKFIFGYKWKETELKTHELDPVNISYSSLSNESDEFKMLLDENPVLRQSFEEQFIAGLSYTFTFSNQVLEKKRNHLFFQGILELSGNTLSLASRLSGSKPSQDDPVKVAGAVYSQFIRAEADVRHYRKITEGTTLAARLYAGSGWAYENSSTLPYIKQFFSGGVSSIRAFPARSLGPGTFFAEEEAQGKFFIDQGGDLKLEGNLELRFTIIGILKGAVFADAGNTWLLRDNPVVPGGLFHTSSFMSELGVGTGWGFRFDVNFFVLRFDLAFPLRKPWLPEGNRWVFNQIRPWSPSWRGENLLLNIAIGYPF